jgi:hypothetical protein
MKPCKLTVKPSGIARQRAALRRNHGTLLTLLSYQVAKTRPIGSAGAKCSKQADLHMNFIDLEWPSNVPQ